jgi:hypothetical protein
LPEHLLRKKDLSFCFKTFLCCSKEWQRSRRFFVSSVSLVPLCSTIFVALSLGSFVWLFNLCGKLQIGKLPRNRLMDRILVVFSNHPLPPSLSKEGEPKHRPLSSPSYLNKGEKKAAEYSSEVTKILSHWPHRLDLASLVSDGKLVLNNCEIIQQS